MHTAIKPVLLRKRFARVILACLLLVDARSSAAGSTEAVAVPGGAPWQAVGDTPQGRIYHRPVAGSSLPEAMIVTRFEAPPARAYALVTDYDHFAEFIPNVAESRVLRQEGGTEWVFHRLHFGAPVADRAYVIESSAAASRQATGYYRVDWKLSGRDFPGLKTGTGVSPRAFTGFWELRPLAGGLATQARYAVHSDPGGFIPDWLVVKMTDRYLQQVIAAVRRRLAHMGAR